jgi:hypothetical protein
LEGEEMIDLWQSRRDSFTEVEYWSQVDDEDLVGNQQLVYNRVPTGTFMAKEISVYSMDSQVVGETVLVDDQSITLFTRDKISDLRVNDKVKYDGKFFRVDNIQKNYVKKQRQFMKELSSAEYYITLRG